MSVLSTKVNAMWTRLRIRRYRAQQTEAARQDRDDEQRSRMLEEGIDPYPRAAGGF